MVSSSQPSIEFARAPTRIYVWRHSPRVGVRADGKTRHETPEPLLGARRRPVRRRARAPARRRRREEAPGGGRLRDPRRGGRAVPAAPRVPVVRGGGALEGRAGPVGRAAVALPIVRREIHIPHRHRAGEPQEAAGDLGRLHQADDVRRSARRLRGDVPDQPPDHLGVAPPPARRRGRLPGPHRAQGAGLDRRDLRQRHRPLPRPRPGEEARAVQAEDMHRRRHRRPQGARRRRLRARQAVVGPDQEGREGPRRGGARPWSTTAGGPTTRWSGRTRSRTSRTRPTSATRPTWRPWRS